MQDLFVDLFDISEIEVFYQPHLFMYVVALLLLIFLSKKLFDFVTPYDLNHKLTKEDNKAVALNFSGYILALILIMSGVFTGDQTARIGEDLLMTFAWGLLGNIFLILAQKVNDKVILSGIDNHKEIGENQNIAIAMAEFGSYVGSGLLIRAAIGAEGQGDLLGDIVSSLIFFITGQLLFVLFALVYQKSTSYDFKNEIEKGNSSAGTSFGLMLVAIGLLASSPTMTSDSIIAFVAWFVYGGAMLLVVRFLVDKFILPGDELDKEITEDRNWGAAVLEGSLAIAYVFIMNTLYYG